MSDKSFSQLFGSINSVPLLISASMIIAGATAYKCIPAPKFENTKQVSIADVPDINEEPIKSN